MEPTISVIVPAFNREETLAATLDSLLGQTHRDWQAIVVDDGSADETASVAGEYAARDPRIRLHRVPNGGVSRARNAGIERAESEWLFFLDADDWVVPDAFERLLAGAQADPDADAVLGACLRIDENGRELWTQHPEHGRDLFPLFARTCAIVIHSCLVKAELIRRAGCFDPSLVTCEDWDLWQRISRIGARFTAIADTVAIYRMRANSASRKGRRMLEDGLVVIDRGHGGDPRLAGARSGALPTAPREARDLARTYFACYAAGLEVANGIDPRPLVEVLGEGISDNVEPEGIAETLFNSVADGRATPPGDWGSFPEEVHERCRDFIGALGERLGDRWHVAGALSALQRLVLSQSNDERPRQVGPWHLIDLDADGAPPEQLRLAPEVELVLCKVRCGALPIGDLELPVVDRSVPPRVLADAVVAAFAWDLLQAFFELHVYPDLEVETAANRAMVSRRGRTLFEGSLNPLRTPRQGIHDRIGWSVFLQELWGSSMSGEEFYEERRGSLAERMGRLAVSTDWIALDVADRLPSLRLRGRDSVSIAVTVGGVPLTAVRCKSRRGTIAAHQLRRAILFKAGFELCRAVLREAVVLSPADVTGSLRERLEAALPRAKPTDELEGVVANGDPRAVATVIGRGQGPDGTAASRWLPLPAAAAEKRIALAELEGDPVSGQPRADAPSLLSAPLVLDGRAGAETGESDELLLRSIDPAARPGDLGQRAGGDGTLKSTRMPILMYHRIAPTGTAATERWRLHPDSFEEQLRYLRDNGFRTLTFDQWRVTADRRLPIPERSVMLTFDDGYADFPTYAMPLLSKYGFQATMFVVTDLVGSTNVWDGDLGETIELMDWETIGKLPGEGIDVGSHSSRHRSLVSLTPEELTEDLCRSRAVLHDRLGAATRAVCYPYGLHDAKVLTLAGACGFHYGVTTNDWHASFGDDLLGLPRVEVRGTEGLSEFAAKLKA